MTWHFMAHRPADGFMNLVNKGFEECQKCQRLSEPELVETNWDGQQPKDLKDTFIMMGLNAEKFWRREHLETRQLGQRS